MLETKMKLGYVVLYLKAYRKLLTLIGCLLWQVSRKIAIPIQILETPHGWLHLSTNGTSTCKLNTDLIRQHRILQILPLSILLLLYLSNKVLVSWNQTYRRKMNVKSDVKATILIQIMITLARNETKHRPSPVSLLPKSPVVHHTLVSPTAITRVITHPARAKFAKAPPQTATHQNFLLIYPFLWDLLELALWHP